MLISILSKFQNNDNLLVNYEIYCALNLVEIDVHLVLGIILICYKSGLGQKDEIRKKWKR